MKLPIFVASMLLLLMACSQSNTTTEKTVQKASMEKETTKQLRHVVLFKFKEGTAAADIQKVCKGCAGDKSDTSRERHS